jgi:5-methylcytosine-specific restriction endonuclease McrA
MSAAYREAYQDYLNSFDWQVRRIAVMKRAGGICECCGERPAEQCHHIRYEGRAFNAWLTDLQAVCRRCHELIHGIHPTVAANDNEPPDVLSSAA